MKIEIWSDFLCPFCYLGKRKLEIALDNFEHKDEVEVIFKSFELDPSAKNNYSENIHELIAKKYNIPVEKAKESNAQITLQGKDAHIDYDFDKIIQTNSFDAHRLAHYAKTEGKSNELSDRLFKAFFEEGLNLSDYKTLSSLAAEVGLDSSEALKILESEQYSSEVRKDEADAARLKINSVPYFVFNNKYALAGAQPSDTFLEVLRKVQKEELSSPSFELLAKNRENEDSNFEGCSDGKCNI